MNRGTIKLSPAEESYLALILNNNLDASTLRNKLLLLESGDSVLEISEDEAELMLDLLPPPQAQQSTIITTCRKKLNDFLMTFRKPIS